MAGRPKGSKNKNRKSLLAWLETHNWDYAYRFKKAFDESSPEEQLRFFKGTLPYMFQRVDTTPMLEANVLNMQVNKISSPEDLIKLLMKDPFVNPEKIVEGDVIDVGGEPCATESGSGVSADEAGATEALQDEHSTGSTEGHTLGDAEGDDS